MEADNFRDNVILEEVEGGPLPGPCLFRLFVFARFLTCGADVFLSFLTILLEVGHLQLRIILIATRIAMMTISTTRTMRR